MIEISFGLGFIFGSMIVTVMSYFSRTYIFTYIFLIFLDIIAIYFTTSSLKTVLCASDQLDNYDCSEQEKFKVSILCKSHENFEIKNFYSRSPTKNLSRKHSDQPYSNAASLVDKKYTEPFISKKDNLLSNKDFNLLAELIKPSILLVFLLVIIDAVCHYFYTPVFVKYYTEKFGISVKECGYIVMTSTLFYIISLKTVGKFLFFFSPKFLLCFALLMNSFSMLLLSPSNLFPQSITYSVIGYSILNLFSGFVSVSSFVDLSFTLQSMGFEDSVAFDNASAICILALNCADFFGPIIGGSMTLHYSFEFTCSLIGLCDLLVSFFFFLCFFTEIRKQLSN